MRKVYDTRSSWSLFSDGVYLRLTLHPPAKPQPFWTAVFNRRVHVVDYYASPVIGDETRRIENPIRYPLDQLLLMYRFAGRRGVLVHAAGMVHQGRAYLFAGASGAGKSTFSELAVQAGYGEMLSDERMIVRKINGRTIAFGTPWAGTAGIARNGHAPLAGVFFMQHGDTNRFQEAASAAATDRILPMLSIPWYDPEAATPIIEFAKRLFTEIPAWEFQFTPDVRAIHALRGFLQTMDT